MGILSWLRRVVADFFCVDECSAGPEAEQLERELQALKAVAALAVAQAGVAELRLREALEAGDARRTELPMLVARLEEERARAAGQVERYRERQTRALAEMRRLGEAQRAVRLNEARLELGEFIQQASDTTDEQALAALEDQARAEAARLDALDALSTGRRPTVPESPRTQEDIEAHARKLIAEDTGRQLWPGS